MRRILIPAILAASFAGCAGLFVKDEASADFDKETSAVEARIKEDRVRSALRRFEESIANFYKSEKRIPERLDQLIPKYLAEVPSLDLPACGRESERVEIYPADILRGGQVDGSRLKGTGHWGYVFNDRQVVIFVDCLKPSSRGIPWYQERGLF
ncbi:MAG: hypothetical protein A2506_12150 [Elusimicrobia bacterium RIFOXYD12_FULL_66_9]|nr:MAG: hypothetical protein A2506_12150 [Elusimicrobia bacterium RIFOXYD12_FULL_66_9]